MLSYKIICIAAGICIGSFLLLLIMGMQTNIKANHWLVARRRSRGIAVDDKKKQTGMLIGLQREAKEAGLDIPSSHLLLCIIGGAAAGAGFAYVITGVVLFSFIGLLFGVFVPRIWVHRRIDGRAKLFETQLEVALGQMSAGLRAGLSAPQVFQQAALSAYSPAREILGMAVHLQQNAGMSLVDAIGDAGKNVKSKSMEVMAAATGLSAHTGANLSMIFDQIADGIRDKRTFKQQVGAITAEMNLSSKAFLFMPFLIVGIFRALNPEYMDPLFKTSIGQIISFVCVGMVLFGYRLVRGIMSVDY